MMKFTETQKFSQPWILLLIGISGLLPPIIFGFGIYQQIILGKPFGNNPMSDNGLIITFILTMALMIGLIALFALAQLTTIIDKQGITYRFFPFQLSFRKIEWTQIDKYEVITYNPIRDYGGWGLRYGKKGRALNVSGNKGLQLYLLNGKNILIGTKKESELTEFLLVIKPEKLHQ